MYLNIQYPIDKLVLLNQKNNFFFFLGISFNHGVGVLGPEAHYPHLYWAQNLSRWLGSFEEEKTPLRGPTLVHNKVHRGQMSPRISKAKIRTSDLPSEMTFCEVLQDTDKHCQYKVWKKVLKYLRGKLQPPH